MKPKIIAMYLPQYHRIPENDNFWGNGFTDWVTVKNAKALYEGHIQPKVPLNDKYYDLSLKEDVAWQASKAKEYGISGFGIYHYWFNNDMNLLTKPAEIIRDNEDIDINYFFAWDNCSWIRSWSNVAGNSWAPVAEKNSERTKGCEILIPYILGLKKDWENHYNYLCSHFKNKSYIKYNNKPVISILTYSKGLENMIDYWNELAIRDGFAGIYVIYRYLKFKGIPQSAPKYNYEPHFSGWTNISQFTRIKRRLCRALNINLKKGIKVYDYDVLWNRLLDYAETHNLPDFYHGAFVSYDDSPRRGKSGAIIVKGATPQKFKKYFGELYRISKDQKKEFIFFTAWNEWGEGAYLEPDAINSYDYLKALKEVIEKK